MNYAESRVTDRNPSNTQPITRLKTRTADVVYRGKPTEGQLALRAKSQAMKTACCKQPNTHPFSAETTPVQTETTLADILFSKTNTVKAALNQVQTALTQAGFVLSTQDIAALEADRTAALVQSERLEFGTPPIGVITEELATSPFLLQENLSSALIEAQECFYRLRDEIDLSFTDEELAWALARRFDTIEGDLETLCATDAADITALLNDGTSEQDESSSEYRIVDDAGTEYVFRPQEWEYDEFAPGWDGEKWGDSLDK